LVEWSKDGATIYVEAKRNLYSLTVVDGQIKKLTNFDETKLASHDFNISPDGIHLVYADRENKQSDIWTSDLDGSNPKRLTNDQADDDNPIWLPDGKRIIYNSERNGIKQICLAYANGREPQQLSLSDSDNVISDISADGTKIVYATTKNDSDIWSVSLETGKESQITSDIGVEFWPDVSPDGSMVAYQAIKRISIGDKLLNSELTAQQIGGDGRIFQLANDGFYPQWSPDGKKLGFLRSESSKNTFLWVVSNTGGDAHRLTEDGAFFGGYSLLPYNRLQTQDFQWSTDSAALIYVAVRSGISNIWQVAADGSGEKQLTNNQDAQVLYFNPLFSPDGKSIVWLAMNFSNPKERSWSIWMLTNGKADEIYKSDAALRLLGWTQTGRELIVKSVESKQEISTSPVDIKLLKVSIASGEPQSLMTLKSAYFNNIRLSPDHRSIAFVSRPATNDAIQTIGLADKAPRTVIESNDPRVYFSSLAFSADGKNVYFGKQANWRVITMVNNFK
jgi:Tol biopolymer transport system component